MTGTTTRSPAPAGHVLRGRRVSRFVLLVIALAGAAVASTWLAVSIGAVPVALPQAWGIVADRLVPGAVPRTWTPVQEQIIWEFRLPRALLALLVGAGLAVVGAVLQALVRNPLADPFLLGVSSGASFGAVLVLILGASALGGLSLSAAAFAGSLLALGLVYVLAQRAGRLTPSRLVLAGVALAYLFQAAYSFVLQLAQSGRAAQQVLFWLMGSLGGARWHLLPLPAVVLAVGVAYLLTQHRPLNALAAGEETAVSLGVNVSRFRLTLFVLTSLLVGVMVATSGAIAFVGLIVPHAARLLVGADHRRVLPVTALLGAVFLQLVDIAARTVNAPQELALSIVTALFGVPFFLWLLRRRSVDRAVTVG
ncbi:FecCD family ABC transporter permease [Nonomuraea wenchangensis]|uniref:Iron complex transport system permease protein n=1 Tax=Nonomuraea wenchangensis TaxID=568860 RepID=A0A1I0AHZ7_9ACTN|nr:iron ABC transporter permease [Nonomuraea wenchangensis]SES93788.1 iron complex transport system permease protein [Nonomuraea wenchangensis]